MKKSFFVMTIFIFIVFCFTGCNNQNNQEKLPETQSNLQTLTYRNEKYGFILELPETWKGYSANESFYEGSSKGEIENVPEVILRHPLWNENEKRQDIPIYILTHKQWKRTQEEYEGEDALNLGPAPVSPYKIGENNEYIFAIPARYNYSLLEGYEEVEQILKDNDPLKTFEV